MSSYNCLTQFLSSSCLLALSSFQIFFSGEVSLSSCLFLPSTSLICLQLYNDEESSVFLNSLFIPLYMQVSLSTSFNPFLSHDTALYLTFLISSSLSLPHTLSLSSFSSFSLCGRVVINPYFIAGEFLSPCRADSSPRSKTLLGPNPILPPSITPSLPPSGPDY